MTTIKLYPEFYKTSGKLSIKNIMKTNDILFDYIKQYKKNKIHGLILDNTFINNKNIKLKGNFKKYSLYTIYALDKSNINKLNKLYKGTQNKSFNFQIFTGIIIKFYNLMNIKNYKRILKYNFILNYPIKNITYNEIRTNVKKFNKVYDVIKKYNDFKILDNVIKECKNNMK
tara:strand:- start:647 stop:1162 length:516 start_codon:yes stop_codon:yes gene_type:complete